MEKIFSDFGIEIFRKDNRYFIEYDAGEIVSEFIQIEVSKEAAELAQLSSDSAYQVILKYN